MINLACSSFALASNRWSVIVLLLLLIFVGGLAGCGSDTSASGSDDSDAAEADRLIVFVAASTTDAMKRVAVAYREKTGRSIMLQAASSSTLARQIMHGAQADVFVSANAQWMDELDRAGVIDRDSRVDLLGNRLVWVVPLGDAESELPVIGATGPRVEPGQQIALGDPAHVPAGIYARQALESLGRWETLERQVIPTGDVRAALRLVELGEVSHGVVYATDAAASQKVRIIWRIPESLHEPIAYPAAVIKQSTSSSEAKRFVAFLLSEEAQAVFREHGFSDHSGAGGGGRDEASATEVTR